MRLGDRDRSRDHGGALTFSKLRYPEADKGSYLPVRSRELACGRQAFIATWLFDPSMSALPIILKQNSVSVGLFTRLRERELGLDRRETG